MLSPPEIFADDPSIAYIAADPSARSFLWPIVLVWASVLVRYITTFQAFDQRFIYFGPYVFFFGCYDDSKRLYKAITLNVLIIARHILGMV